MKTATATGAPPISASLARLHERKIAVELTVVGRKRTVVGEGIYERDDELGPILRIELDSTADGELILAEDEWNGDILSGQALGCDFLIRLN